MDYMLSKFPLISRLYQIVALTCLIIAAKYDELDRNIPRLSDFLRASEISATKEAVMECEMSLLDRMGWNLKIVTPIVFVHLLLSQGVVFGSDKTNKYAINEQLAKKISKMADFFVDSATERTIYTNHI